MHEMTAAADDLQPPVAEPGERLTVTERGDLVAVPVDDQRRTVKFRGQLAKRASVALNLTKRGGDQRVSVGVQHPPNAILDRLGRMRLREAARDEPIRELGVALAPVGGVQS